VFYSVCSVVYVPHMHNIHTLCLTLVCGLVHYYFKKLESIQKQPSYKKKYVAPEKTVVKQDVKSKVVAKKWL